MNKKKHNHKYPNFLLKNWSLKPFSKSENRRVNYIRNRHMGEKNYYPDDLEIKLSRVENVMSKIAKKILSGDYNLSNLELARIIIYVKIQTIRLENIVEYINEPDAYFPGKNNFIFGVYSTNHKNTIIETTDKLSNIFLLDDISTIEESNILIGLSPIIWKSKESIFCVSDNAVFKEVDLDGKFLFSFLPISPSHAIIVSKNSYFSSFENLKGTLRKMGDHQMSMSIKDKFLINNYKHEGLVHLPFSIGAPNEVPIYEVNKYDVLRINSAFMKDAKKLIFYDGNDEEIHKYIAFNDYSREVILY